MTVLLPVHGGDLWMPASAYDEIADWYDENICAGGSLGDLVARWVLEQTGDLAGQHLCDLACGQGLMARYLARRGARVTGIDLSAKLLEAARRYEEAEPLGITYEWGDAQCLKNTPGAVFDGVVCHLALMDIPDLAATFRAVYRVLRPEGWFLFSITHPCFQMPAWSPPDQDIASEESEASRYFWEGFWRSDYPHGVRGRVGAYHRTLSTYLNTLSDASLILERLIEPQGTGETASRLCTEGGEPKFLIVKCTARL
jgi:2-polyprenyl-3-methyl-5-hydroxy-6-metoxy-1,4-benzoquinol methylase